MLYYKILIFNSDYYNALDVEKRKNPVCGFVTPLEGTEADAHRKPEVINTKYKYLFKYI